MLGNACSSDTDVSFGSAPQAQGGDANGGSKLTAGDSGAGASLTGGASASGGSNAGSGNSAGSSAAGSATAGTGSDAGGTATAGAASGGTGTAGSGTAGSAGSSGGAGGTAGSASSGAGAGGMAGQGGSAGGAGMAGNAGAGGGGDCTAASFAGHSYYFCGLVDSAPAALAKCQSLGMNVVSIESQAENAFVASKQKGSSWLGGTDELQEGKWRWLSSGALFWDGPAKGALPPPDGAIDGVYDDFIVGQPNDNGASGAHENCLVLSASGWNDLVCDLTGFHAACESSGPVIQPKP